VLAASRSVGHLPAARPGGIDNRGDAEDEQNAQPFVAGPANPAHPLLTAGGPFSWRQSDLDAQPATILGWFVSRWRVETTFQEVQAHLGVETQRQWSDLAILRTTPALLGLFSLITVWADGLARDAANALRPNVAAW
jgi:hypothetical protein